MIRALLRLLSLITLAIAVIMAVLDATRSIAANAPVLTPLGASWRGVFPGSLDALQLAIVENLPAFVWDPAMTTLLRQPGFAVFAVLALLLALAGRPRRPARRMAMQR